LPFEGFMYAASLATTSFLRPSPKSRRWRAESALMPPRRDFLLPFPYLQSGGGPAYAVSRRYIVAWLSSRVWLLVLDRSF